MKTIVIYSLIFHPPDMLSYIPILVIYLHRECLSFIKCPKAFN